MNYELDINEQKIVEQYRSMKAGDKLKIYKSKFSVFTKWTRSDSMSIKEDIDNHAQNIII